MLEPAGRVLCFASLLLTSSIAAAQGDVAATVEPGDGQPQRLGLFAGAGYLGTAGGHGAAFTTGARLALGRHFALGFDAGYGLLDAGATKQDRWWLMPSAALVLPLGPLRFDLGAGLGLGATSGYTSWPAYQAAPFTPVWAFQLVPAARGHVQVATTLSSSFDVFARFEVASLLLGGNTIGSRVGNPNPGLTDTIWVGLWLGAQLKLF